MGDGELRRLRSIEIDGLFGFYDHRIDLKTEDRVTVLHGANGVGKTTVLGMIDALLRNDMGYFARIHFKRFQIDFMDASSIELVPGSEIRVMGRKRRTATLSIDDTVSGKRENQQIELTSNAVEELAEELGFLHRISDDPSFWEDVRDGDILSEQEVLGRYGSRLENSEPSSPSDEKSYLSDFLKGVDAHFIDVQRLRRHVKPTRPRRYYRTDYSSTREAVLECSRNFQVRLGDMMASYGRDAQRLDQTFPQRLMGFDAALDPEELTESLDALKQSTDDLAQIGILSKAPEVPFDTTRLDSTDATQRRVMTLYVQDTQKKMAVLRSFADRTRALLHNVNGKFRDKRIRVDQRQGLVAEVAGGDAQYTLSLDALSSGEQHELVMHYDLLFRVKPNTVVLIDEPELSLHVAWQKQFLPELIGIAKVAGFDAVLATHSPYIVSDRDDLLVALGEPGAGA